MKKNTSKKQMAGKGKKEIQGDFAFYIGIDLGDKNSDVCVLNPGGEVDKQFRLRMKEEAFQEYFASIPRSRVAVEAGATGGWWHYVGLQGEIIGIDHFGASAPAKDLFKAYGFTAEHVVEAIEKVLAK